MHTCQRAHALKGSQVRGRRGSYALRARPRDGAKTRPSPKDRARAARLSWVEDTAREASGPNALAAAFKSATAAYTCLQALHVPDDELRADRPVPVGRRTLACPWGCPQIHARSRPRRGCQGSRSGHRHGP